MLVIPLIILLVVLTVGCEKRCQDFVLSCQEEEIGDPEAHNFNFFNEKSKGESNDRDAIFVVKKQEREENEKQEENSSLSSKDETSVVVHHDSVEETSRPQFLALLISLGVAGLVLIPIFKYQICTSFLSCLVKREHPGIDNNEKGENDEIPRSKNEVEVVEVDLSQETVEGSNGVVQRINNSASQVQTLPNTQNLDDFVRTKAVVFNQLVSDDHIPVEERKKRVELMNLEIRTATSFQEYKNTRMDQLVKRGTMKLLENEMDITEKTMELQDQQHEVLGKEKKLLEKKTKVTKSEKRLIMKKLETEKMKQISQWRTKASRRITKELVACVFFQFFCFTFLCVREIRFYYVTWETFSRGWFRFSGIETIVIVSSEDYSLSSMYCVLIIPVIYFCLRVIDFVISKGPNFIGQIVSVSVALFLLYFIINFFLNTFSIIFMNLIWIIPVNLLYLGALFVSVYYDKIDLMIDKLKSRSFVWYLFTFKIDFGVWTVRIYSVLFYLSVLICAIFVRSGVNYEQRDVFYIYWSG